MDWNTIINYLVKALMVILLGVAEVYVIPWLNAKRKEINQRAEDEGWANVLAIIDKFVAGAEQIAISEGHDGAWKKKYVISMVEQYLDIDVDAELDAYIESAVILLHNTLYGKVGK